MKKIIPIAVICVVLIYLLSNSHKTPSQDAYIEEINQERIDKNQFLSTSSNSPFYSWGDTVIQLKYFPIDESYKVIAKVSLIEENRVVTLGNSDGSTSTYRKYAVLTFDLNNQTHSLLVLKNLSDGEGKLFTAFADETSAEETYGAGRYLDLEFNRAQRITLDFNLAYNPYCNYNHEYSCPLPPKENFLHTEVRAGEKDYEKENQLVPGV
ncbi:hypothetical protein SAMN04488028_11149 [Reichenbachiella agariperforans]|uniref:DUF1684 domain-containing protein n=1 Tax=Reichenbachiella agariperforans TaxID=156994 RepID=A0A1M6WD09_REIAG|nr:DUF1684 domain-containing protein [Reichenbachiella agariperforans]SHK91539.1 hypothetical protein SAMN04488028_11149 [Reichenbachiella agariperforans]